MAYDYKDNMPADCDLSVYSGEDTSLVFQWNTKEGESEVLTPVDITGGAAYLTIGKGGVVISQINSSTADETGYITFAISQEDAVVLLSDAFKVRKLDYDIEVQSSTGVRSTLLVGEMRILADRAVRS